LGKREKAGRTYTLLHFLTEREKKRGKFPILYLQEKKRGIVFQKETLCSKGEPKGEVGFFLLALDRRGKIGGKERGY